MNRLYISGIVVLSSLLMAVYGYGGMATGSYMPYMPYWGGGMTYGGYGGGIGFGGGAGGGAYSGVWSFLVFIIILIIVANGNGRCGFIKGGGGGGGSGYGKVRCSTGVKSNNCW